MTERTSEKKVAGTRWLILIGIMGIVGLILLAFGVFLLFERSLLPGVISLVLGVFVYFVFIVIERKLKLL
jgi:membrane-bound ClpP family serine protease